jgi:hypothetical protein
MKTSNQNIDLIEISSNNKNTSLNASSTKRKSEYMPVHKENMKSQLDECIKSTKECCSNLFDLSLIVPSAPWVKFRNYYKYRFRFLRSLII